MKPLKATMTILASAMMAFGAVAGQQTIVDRYQFKMSLYVPRVYDNAQSLGYRKYQKQYLSGQMLVKYKDGCTSPVVSIEELVNNTHKIGGKKITYDCYLLDEDNEGAVTSTLVAAVGSNRTEKFDKVGVKFSFVADPSYNIGEVEEDNSLYVSLSGVGSLALVKKYLCQIPNRLKGSVTGCLGCGCTEYGHKSPTRLYLGWVTDIVSDIAPVYGTWQATFKDRQTMD